MSISELLNGQKLLVVVDEHNGLGDISCGIKCARALIERSFVPKEQVIFLTSSVEKAALFDPDKTLDVRPLYRDSIKTKLVEIENVALQVIVPAVGNLYPSIHVTRDVPTLAFSEYCISPPLWDELGDPRFTSYPLGLSDSKEAESSIIDPYTKKILIDIGMELSKPLGIFIDPNWRNLHEISDSQELKIQKLEELSDEAKNIVGSLTRFDQGERLFFGYVSKQDITWQKQFFEEALEQVTQGTDCTFIFPNFNCGNDIQKIASRLGVKKVIIKEHTIEIEGVSAIAEMFKAQKRMEYYQATGNFLEDEEEEKRFVSKIKEQNIDLQEQGSTITICSGSFNHQDLLVLLAASEKQVLITGDQSLTEAISANKIFFYEKLKHKNRLADRVSTLYQGALTQGIKSLFSEESETIFSQKNREICESKNCYPEIESLIKQSLNTPIDETKKMSVLAYKGPITADMVEQGRTYWIDAAQAQTLSLCGSSDEFSIHMHYLVGTVKRLS